jgi:hypothetical protein
MAVSVHHGWPVPVCSTSFQERNSVTIWIFFEGLNILSSTFCVCADDFQGLSKNFHYPVLFICFFEITYLF